VQPLDFLHETEGTRPRHLAHIGVLGKIDAHLLTRAIDRRMIEADRERQAETIVGIEARPLVAGGVISRTSIGV
jgi:adenine/guanine phosphoribosyltransferase-like PRPP-binding protein